MLTCGGFSPFAALHALDNLTATLKAVFKKKPEDLAAATSPTAKPEEKPAADGTAPAAPTATDSAPAAAPAAAPAGACRPYLRTGPRLIMYEGMS